MKGIWNFTLIMDHENYIWRETPQETFFFVIPEIWPLQQQAYSNNY